MSNETTKSNNRRLRDSCYKNKYFVGHGIDIGAGTDCLDQHLDIYPNIISCKNWDLPDGDAQYLYGIKYDTYDFIHSSHCLEHMEHPSTALFNWIRVLKPGGHAVIIVPDEDMYEQRIFPSTFNHDHKWTFTIYKAHGSKDEWSEKSINIIDLVKERYDCKTISIRLNEENFDYTMERCDQTRGAAESSIEFILRKL